MNAPIICFYSFKGGVGRTLALYGAAVDMYRTGRRVLIVDGDLEAPGLSLTPPLDTIARGHEGFLELLLQIGAGAEAPRVTPVRVPADNLTKADVEGGLVDLLPAGYLEGPYAARLDQLRLSDIFDRGDADRFFEVLTHALSTAVAADGEPYDLVMIDLRTGLSDISLQLAARLAKVVVVLSALNHQNITGSALFLASLRKSNPEASLVLVASPVPTSEEREKRERLKCWEDALGSKPDILIHYHPLFALTENLAAWEDIDALIVGEHRELARTIRDRLKWGVEDQVQPLLDALVAGDIRLAVKLIPRIHAELPHALSPVLRAVPLRSGSTLETFVRVAERLAQQGALPPPLARNIQNGVIERDSRLSESVATVLGTLVEALVAPLSGEKRKRARVDLLDAIADNSPPNDARQAAALEAYDDWLTAHPQDADRLGNYALFVGKERGDLDRAEALYKRAIAADPNHATHLGNYALFLVDERGDVDGAEAFYARAIEADPNDAHVLSNYALFLDDVRGDPNTSSDMLRRALELAPEDANVRVNLSRALGRTHDFPGSEAEAHAALGLSPDADAELEAWFYLFVYGASQDTRAEALENLRRQLLDGVRSPGWPLAKDARLASQRGHEAAELVAALAAVISDGAPLEGLDRFEAWQRAEDPAA